MPALLTSASTMMCPHGGTVSVVSANTRMQAGGGFVLRSSDTFIIAGCALSALPTPQPCGTFNSAETGMRREK